MRPMESNSLPGILEDATKEFSISNSPKDCPSPYIITEIKNDEEEKAKSCCSNLFACCKYDFLPSWILVSRFLMLIILGLMIWGSAFSVLGHMAGPGGQLFKIGFLGTTAYIAGHFATFLGLPPLLGMMAMGIVLRNTEFVVISGPFLQVTASLREIALFLILTRSGLEVDPAALKRLCGMVARIVLVPAAMEAVTIAVATYFLLNLPWIYGFLLGSVLAAISPAVIIPCILHLQTIGNYGKSKGIPTLVIAATSFDDIICITAFSVLLGIITSTGSITAQITQAVVAVLIGLSCGIALGMVLRYVPHQNDRRASMLRTLSLIGGGLMLMFGSRAIGYGVAGPLACVVVSFVASNGWDPSEKEAVQENIEIMWEIFQPILFGLIGCEINLFVLHGYVVGLGVLSLLFAIWARMLASVVVTVGGNFNWKERIFISLTWLPKATVQAALGPTLLDRVRELQLLELVPYAEIILVITVLSILITAPLGGILITSLGPKLLKKEEREPTTGQDISIHL